jgi:hypothetical protein
MRSTCISVIVVSVVVTALLCVGVWYVHQAVYDMEEIRLSSLRLNDDGRKADALAEMVRMAVLWEQRAPILEMMVNHEDLHSISSEIAEAKTNLECDHMDDFNRSMTLLGEALEHIEQHERLRMANIL